MVTGTSGSFRWGELDEAGCIPLVEKRRLSREEGDEEEEIEIVLPLIDVG
tara:strand:+ start:647 stop:796 length:150 start_codon:yes stop_codon:yes gene_type:complete